MKTDTKIDTKTNTKTDTKKETENLPEDSAAWMLAVDRNISAKQLEIRELKEKIAELEDKKKDILKEKAQKKLISFPAHIEVNIKDVGNRIKEVEYIFKDMLELEEEGNLVLTNDPDEYEIELQTDGRKINYLSGSLLDVWARSRGIGQSLVSTHSISGAECLFDWSEYIGFRFPDLLSQFFNYFSNLWGNEYGNYWYRLEGYKLKKKDTNLRNIVDHWKMVDMQMANYSMPYTNSIKSKYSETYYEELFYGRED